MQLAEPALPPAKTAAVPAAWLPMPKNAPSCSPVRLPDCPACLLTCCQALDLLGEGGTEQHGLALAGGGHVLTLHNAPAGTQVGSTDTAAHDPSAHRYTDQACCWRRLAPLTVCAARTPYECRHHGLPTAVQISNARLKLNPDLALLYKPCCPAPTVLLLDPDHQALPKTLCVLT